MTSSLSRSRMVWYISTTICTWIEERTIKGPTSIARKRSITMGLRCLLWYVCTMKVLGLSTWLLKESTKTWRLLKNKASLLKKLLSYWFKMVFWNWWKTVIEEPMPKVNFQLLNLQSCWMNMIKKSSVNLKYDFILFWTRLMTLKESNSKT